ncbi:MAG: hypothetical protein JWN98_2569 [Abditibacteriota bacterium]|nr:hypothetical protein [Abditibacteriota bacterium]
MAPTLDAAPVIPHNVPHMNENFHEFKARLSELDLLGRLTSSRSEQDSMLHRRDEEAFDAQWVRAYNAVEQVEQQHQLHPETENAIDELREAIFLKALDQTGHNEIAAYVADDFDLLSRAVVAGYSDAWLDWLWAAYQAGEFPHTLPDPNTPNAGTASSGTAPSE